MTWGKVLEQAGQRGGQSEGVLGDGYLTRTGIRTNSNPATTDRGKRVARSRTRRRCKVRRSVPGSQQKAYFCLEDVPNLLQDGDGAAVDGVRARLFNGCRPFYSNDYASICGGEALDLAS